MITMLIVSLLFLYFLQANSFLYPVESPHREVKSLDGIWDFLVSPRFDQDVGFREEWFKKRLIDSGDVIAMPVPSSYNDVTQNKTLRDYIGWVWYDREFLVPSRWKTEKQRVVLRISSASYAAIVWCNGVQVMNHSIGHLPFEVEVTDFLTYTGPSHITVAVNNTLTPHTIPQGEIIYKDDPSMYPPGYFIQTFDFGFFNYAGIHRPVTLYTTPQNYISDITVYTDVDGATGIVNYDIEALKSSDCAVKVAMLDKAGTVAAEDNKFSGVLSVDNANLWWPYLMHGNPGYLYNLLIQTNCSSVLDSYTLPVGIRKLSWNSTSFLINNKNIYFKGFGKHEDTDIRGKGLDIPLIVKDFNLIRWFGANSFRTSHYPYADELMMMADEQGIMVIDESPAINLKNFDSPLLQNHIQAEKELIQRDKNHPSVVMWSMGNEPRSSDPKSSDYFKTVADTMRIMDPSRPVTLVIAGSLEADVAAQHLDIICHNSYFGWYTDMGHTEVIQRQLVNTYTAWYEKHKKPLIISEYGAGTIDGFHSDPSQSYTEDYQVELLSEHFEGFDVMRSKGYWIGEMIWNFADFNLPQAAGWVGGCMKGVLTRQRRPKAAAHVLRARYWNLTKQEQ